MPSLDIVSRIDYAELDNAINNTKKAIVTRFDFRNSPVEFTIDKKEKTLRVVTEDGKQEAVREMFINAAIKRGLQMKAFEWGEVEKGASGNVKRTVKLKDGLPPELCKTITKTIKESKMKVQASIQGEEVRITGKQIDDLRAVMAMLNAEDLPQALQFTNMKS